MRAPADHAAPAAAAAAAPGGDDQAHLSAAVAALHQQLRTSSHVLMQQLGARTQALAKVLATSQASVQQLHTLSQLVQDSHVAEQASRAAMLTELVQLRTLTARMPDLRERAVDPLVVSSSPGFRGLDHLHLVRG